MSKQSPPTDEKVFSELHHLFEDAREEVFEYGIKTEFSTQLVTLITQYGEKAINVLADLLHAPHITVETKWESIRWLGKIDDPFTHQVRRRLLERCLGLSVARLRDAAIQGLAFMDDPHSIPYLKKAIEGETIPELREDMVQVLKQLEETLLENSKSAIST